MADRTIPLEEVTNRGGGIVLIALFGLSTR